MTAPTNNDAALVREWIARMREQDWPAPDLNLLEVIDRLAATAERADELQAFYDERIDLWHCTMDDHRAAGEYLQQVQAALLAAQQERDEARKERNKARVGRVEWRNEGIKQKERAERAEATNTQLREALERIADSHASFTEMQEAARAALAQDAEQAQDAAPVGPGNPDRKAQRGVSDEGNESETGAATSLAQDAEQKNA